MKNKFLAVWFSACVLSVGAVTASNAAELAVVVHPSNTITTISYSELADIYLGRSDEFANGRAVAPLNQDEQSPARHRFSKEVLGMDEGALSRYWAKLMFSGKGQPPEELGSDEEIRAAVAANMQAIGYINKSAVNSSVKVVLIIP